MASRREPLSVLWELCQMGEVRLRMLGDKNLEVTMFPYSPNWPVRRTVTYVATSDINIYESGAPAPIHYKIGHALKKTYESCWDPVEQEADGK